MRQVIIDTDPGTDDSLAILLALSQPDIEVIGLTTVQGNQSLEQINANASSLVNYLGLETPIYSGGPTEAKILSLSKASAKPTMVAKAWGI
ncbi:nucleoside hydrolase [Aerococcus urinae]